jgi:DNA polymerase III epsilon subunit-like protein
MNILVVDTETTGLTPVGTVSWRSGAQGIDRVASYALVAVVNGAVVKSAYQLLNPCMPMPAAALAVNGLSDDMLCSQPLFTEHAPRILKAFGWADIVVGHNVRFDLDFLNAELKLAGLGSLPIKPTVDTHRIAKAEFQFVNNKLTTITSAWTIQHTAHNALGDCEATLQVLKRMLVEKYPGVPFDTSIRMFEQHFL